MARGNFARSRGFVKIISGGQLFYFTDRVVRLVGVITPKRMPPPRHVAVSDTDLPGFEVSSWFALMGPGRHSEGHCQSAGAGSEEGAGRSGGQVKLNAQALTPRGTTSKEFGSAEPITACPLSCSESIYGSDGQSCVTQKRPVVTDSLWPKADRRAFSIRS
jgi:hypothetical protein